MKNKLACAIALVATLHSPLSAALRLGNIAVDSNVNEPLRATIELGSAKNVAAERILVQMASADDFRKANIEKPYHLNDISFKVEQGPNGKILRLTSSKKITEPYLNFILDTRWPNGRVLREYLVLLDLPIHSSAAGSAVQQSSASPLAYKSGSSTNKSPVGESVLKPAAKVAASSGSANSGSNSSNQQYRVRANDTLWDIADEHRAMSASVEQSMHALFNSNPHAFTDANINQLKKGAVLRIPSEEEQTHIAHQQAKSWQKNQYAEWKKARALPSNLKQSLDASTQSKRVASQNSKPDGHLTLTANLKSEQHQARAEKSLADVVSDNLSTESDTGSSDNVVSTLEQLDRKSLEHEALQDRYANLQERFGQLEKLIALKNAQLAELTASIQKSEDILEELEGSSEQGAGAIDDSIAPEYLSVADSGGSIELQGAEADSTAGQNEPGNGSSLAVGDQDFEGQSAGEQLAAAALVGKAAPTGSPAMPDGEPPQPPAPITPPPASESGVAAIIQQITSSLPSVIQQNLQWIAAGFGALLVSGLGLFAFLRRRSSDVADEGEIDTEFLEQLEASEEELTFANQKLSPHQWSTDIEEPQALSSDDAEAEGQVSPAASGDQLAEIDIFLAYGRHDKAIEALSNLIDNDAENVDYRLKLVEIYLAEGNNDAAHAAANTVLEMSPELESTVNKLLEADTVSDSTDAVAEEAVAEADLSAPEALDSGTEDLNTEGALDFEASLDGDLDLEIDNLPESAESLDGPLTDDLSSGNLDPAPVDFDGSQNLKEFDPINDGVDLESSADLTALEEDVGGSASYDDQVDSVSDMDFAQTFSEIEEQPLFESVDGIDSSTEVEPGSLDLDVSDDFALSGGDSLLDTEVDLSADIESTDSAPLTADQQLEQDIADAYGEVGDELLNESAVIEEEFVDNDFDIESADLPAEAFAESSEDTAQSNTVQSGEDTAQSGEINAQSGEINAQGYGDVVDSLIEKIDESLELPGLDSESTDTEFQAESQVDTNETDQVIPEAANSDSGDAGTSEVVSESPGDALNETLNETLNEDTAQIEQLSDADLEAEYQSASEMLEQIMDESAAEKNQLVEVSKESGQQAEDQSSLNEEVATKLDLARAYLEMGDIDGAKDVLDEVLEEGSSDQQQEANQMLQKIA